MSVLLFVPLMALGAPVRRIPLDESRVVTIAIGTDAPTTVRFPGSIAGLEVANVSARPEDRPAVLLSHQPGTALFSVRALKPDAKAAANVIYGGKVYVLDFVVGSEPDRSVVFLEEPGRTIDRNLLSQAKPESLVAWARNWLLAQAQEPELAKGIRHATPWTVTEYRDFRVRVEEVWRFEKQDALVFRLRIENRGRTTLRIDPGLVAIRVGKVFQRVATVDAPDGIAAKDTADLWAVAFGEGKGLSVDNKFRAIVPRAA